MKIRRINLYAGPCTGKSTVAAWLFSELKIAGHNIQLIDEYVKRWAYEKRNIDGFDQLYIFSKHVFAEESYLRCGTLTITDCPLLQTAGYCVRNQNKFAQQLIDLALQFEEKYPSINIWLNRAGIDYKREGRYEDYQAAVETDKILYRTLNSCSDHAVFNTLDRDKILEYIKGQLCE